jgi:nitrite reductase/ring-hydroxylating ferredoxin subunit
MINGPIQNSSIDIWYGRDTKFSKSSKQERDLQEGGLLGAQINGNGVVLVMVEVKVYAMNAIYSHKGAPLEEGTLMRYDLKCPWHFTLFNVCDEKVSAKTVWVKDMESYPGRVDEATGDILVSIGLVMRDRKIYKSE